MRTFASHLRWRVGFLILTLTTLVPGSLLAQDSPAAALFNDARALEVSLRKEIGTYRSGVPAMPLVRRARILVGTYEDIARLFPDGGYADKSLWQGASLAADVFDVFKEGADRAAAVRLTTSLETKYPSSTFVAQAHRRLGTLAAAPDPATVPVSSAEVVAPVRSVSPPPRPAKPVTPATTTLLHAIHREVLPDVLRVSIELDREAVFHEERLDGPPRVFVDLPNTRAASDIKDARLTFEDDVVRQIRVGRQLDRRIRVVLDLSEAPVHSVYTLYKPFRIVVDFERHRADVVPPPVLSRATVTPAPKAAELPAVKVAAVTSPVVSPPVAAPQAVPVPTLEVKPTNNAPPTVTAATVATPPVPAPKREVALTPPKPARPAGGLSMSRQLGLGVARVVIDPGHGGHDPGAAQDGINEAELVLDVALRLEQLLQKEGIEAILTRRSNVYVALEERPAMAMREEADLYLSIHANASADKRVRGVETYILNFAPNAQSASVAARENLVSSRTMRNLPDLIKAIALNNKIDESRDLARQVQSSLIEKLSKGNRTVRNLGVKQAPFAVLVGADMPSILAEIGFITNKQDAALVKTAVYRQQIAEALASGIVRYQKRLKPSQVAVSQ